VTAGPAATTGQPALLPPPGLAELDPAWSRLVEAVDADGVRRTWHLLDNQVADPVGTLLCVHGNPTWSYLWRRVLAAPPAGWRVVAVDQLDMGFSERTGTVRGLARRVDDLGRVSDALGLTGPVVTVAHDWGGPVSLGWALAHREQVAGMVLANTAVHQPAGAAAPSLIRLARTPGVLRTACVTTPTFLRGALAMAEPPLSPGVRAGFAAPYGSAARRAAIGAFVADIPLAPEHPSAAALDDVANRLGELADRPALLLWGPEDPVFADRYLRDLLARLPHADVHRFEGSSHLVTEDPRAAGAVRAWVESLGERRPAAPAAADPVARRPMGAALAERLADPAPALVEQGAHPRVISWSTLAGTVERLAAGFGTAGIAPGDRVALLVPPGADLTAALYACWRVGAVPVVADAGLGARGIGRALRGAGPDHLIGVPKALAAARALRWPGRAVVAGPTSRAQLRVLGAALSLADIARLGEGAPPPPWPGPDDDAIVVFTSGATGPAKGVVYRHRQLEAQRDALVRTYAITAADSIASAFAPFALFGPALGVTSIAPEMDVTRPATLTARALADAVAAVDATVAIASPAALVNVVATAGDLDDRQRRALAGTRLLLSFGAPVPADLLRSALALMPAAQAHTPYGMTEALPVTDVDLAMIEAAGPGNGVCVGLPVSGVRVALSPLGPDGAATGPLTSEAGVTGEICVAADHLKDHYDRLWFTEQDSRDGEWHRTGDVGHLDEHGWLWVEGRLGHVIPTADGVVTPVGVERQTESVDGVARAAAVGVGPTGAQQVVVVVERAGPAERRADGPLVVGPLADAVRAAVSVPVAAVLAVPGLPVDIRHNSKIDRVRVAAWAERVLAGSRAGRP